MTDHIPRVSARKYQQAPTLLSATTGTENGPPRRTAARVAFRPKGSSVEGHTYEGQTLIKPCRNCPATPPPPSGQAPAE